MASLTQKILWNAPINVMDWPPRSPDLNPIENVWDLLGRRLRQVRNFAQNLSELGDMLVQSWWRIITQVVFRRIIQSIRRHYVAVVNAHGCHTPYWHIIEWNIPFLPSYISVTFWLELLILWTWFLLYSVLNWYRIELKHYFKPLLLHVQLGTFTTSVKFLFWLSI